MDYRVETIKKNFEERMNEFVNILNREDRLPGCKVLDEWRFHLELTLKKSGWLALYRPLKGPRQFLPGVDLRNEVVMVEKVEFHTFEAYVVGAEQSETGTCSSDTSSNKVFCVPLEDLYPCVSQPDSELDGIEVSNILDQFRFFRVNLWLPWDEEDDGEDWRVSALEPRMQLLYDMDQGLVSCEVSERVKRVWRQAWELHDSLQNLEVAIDDEATVLVPVPVETRADEDEGLVITIMQLHHRLDAAKHELERLQNPLIRNLMVREKQRILQRSRKSGLPWSRLVWSGGDTQSLAALVSEATMLTGSDQRFKVYPLLPMALEEASAGDFVLLAPDTVYTITGSAGLESGGSIRGLGKEMSRVSGCEAGDVMLNIACPQSSCIETAEDDSSSSSSTSSFAFTVSNVLLEAYNMEICLLVNLGHVLLENCTIDGGGSHNKEDSVGAMVRGGGRLVARNCLFTGFTSGLIAYDDSDLHLVNCQIKNCEMGIQAYKGARLRMEECVVSECSSSGVYYKWSSLAPTQGNKVVAQEMLNSLPGVTVSETEFQSVPLVVQISEFSPNTSTNSNICL